MQLRPTLVIVGASTAVGQMALRLMPLREDRWGEIRLADEPDRSGSVVVVRGEQLVVRELCDEIFDGADLALFCTDERVSREWVPRAVAAGAVAVDDSTAFRLDPDVPLVVPAINPSRVRQRPRGIIANPGCTVLMLLDVLAPLSATWGLREVTVTTLQAASGIGDQGLAQLYGEMSVLTQDPAPGQSINSVRAALDGPLAENSPFEAPIAMNVIPWIGDMMEGGWSSMERAVQEECRKVLGWGSSVHMAVTCVRVPVAIGHSVSVHATFEKHVTADQARQVLIEAPSVVVLDDPDHNEWPTPVDAVGSDPTFVGRIRCEDGHPHCVNLFLCADNIRKGAALNLLEVAELLHDQDAGRTHRAGEDDAQDDDEES